MFRNVCKPGQYYAKGLIKPTSPGLLGRPVDIIQRRPDVIKCCNIVNIMQRPPDLILRPQVLEFWPGRLILYKQHHPL
jgi:hypothetical protein